MRRRNYERHFHERETDIAADFIHVPADGVIHAGQLPLQHCGQLFRRADQRGSDDGVITGLPGSKFYQCGWNWVWRWNQRRDRLLIWALGDHEKADQAATQGLVLAVIHGVVMTVCCIAIMPVFLRMFTASEAVIELGVRYSAVAFAFTLIVTVSMAFEKLFQAVGNMKTTMISLMCGCITNIVLDPVLIFGYGPFPEMGIEGAALATGIGQALTLAIYLVIYFVRSIRVHIRRQHILPGKKMVIKLYSIGIPATLNLALPSLLISALNAILAAYSEVYILVLGIYYKLQTFIYLPANGIVQGMRPLIGYNYGAGESTNGSVRFIRSSCA